MICKQPFTLSKDRSLQQYLYKLRFTAEYNSGTTRNLLYSNQCFSKRTSSAAHEGARPSCPDQTVQFSFHHRQQKPPASIRSLISALYSRMSAHSVTISKASFAASLLKPDPTPVSRPEVAQFHSDLDALLQRCSNFSIQV